MAVASPRTYLSGITDLLRKPWPDNRTVNIVCHGHSVPSGYFATPVVDTFNAYPHLLHVGLKTRFPFAVINVIVTAIGGENSEQGAERLEHEVSRFRPDVLTLDYGLNDRRLGLEKAADAWRAMIKRAKRQGVKIILVTPSADVTQLPEVAPAEREQLKAHAEQIRRLAAEYGTGLADGFAAFDRAVNAGTDLSELLSWQNHPSRKGHELIARELLRWFPAYG
jgi:lysophospholipase L1-like esterase